MPDLIAGRTGPDPAAAPPATPDPFATDGNWLRSDLPMPAAAALAMTLGESLSEVAARHPDRLAIVSATERVTFAGLMGLAGALAEAIRNSGTPDGPVALLLPAGAAYIAAWFACAAAGRPMLMVELANPPARNARLLDAAGATLVLHDGSPDVAEAIGGRPGLLVAGALPPRPLRAGGLAAEEPAFLFATSGSSGVPKLVVYSQATVQGKVQCSAMVMGVGAGDTVMIAGSHANFGVLHHALVFLFRGGTLCLHDIREGGLSGMFAAIERFGVNHLRFTPSLFRTVAAMPEAAAALRRARAIRFAGEPLLRADIECARTHVAPDCAIQNLYGSTESMIFFWSDRREELPPSAVVPNGRIYPVAEFMLVDDAGQPVPKGDAGELVISSRLHALGDWIGGRVDPSRFPPDPRGEGRRLYRTGDIARLLPDGTMVVQGRKDRLVKINGQRVSLLEIEAELRTMPGCTQAVVLERRQDGMAQLLAFLVLGGTGIPPADPAAWLAARLPRYMVPARFTRVAELPLLPGGKVDGRALLALVQDQPDDAAAVMPGEPELLRFLRGTWSELLGVPSPDLEADFFALGGDSLKLLELTLAVERHTGRQLSPAAFLQRPTIRGLMTVLDTQAVPQGVDPAPATPPGTPFIARGRLTLRRLRHAEGVSRGIVLGVPHYHGHTGPAAMLAAHTLKEYEVWAFSADLGGRRNIRQDEAWLPCAMEVAERIVATPWLRPRALFGYSMGGYVAWLVDRILAGRTWRPARVIAFDSGPLHGRRRDLRDRVEALIADGTGQLGEMLLLRRSTPAPFRMADDIAERWAALGVPCHPVPFRTVSHSDLMLPLTSIAARHAMAAFVEGAGAASRALAADPGFPSAGGTLHDLLSAGAPPDPASLSPLVEKAASLRDPSSRLVLLFLVVASGDHELALDAASRLRAAFPRDRMATYAFVGLHALRGDRAAAVGAAEAWCRQKPQDRAMRVRAEPSWHPPRSWLELAELPIGSDAAMDRALGLLHAAMPGRRTA